MSYIKMSEAKGPNQKYLSEFMDKIKLQTNTNNKTVFPVKVSFHTLLSH